MKIVANVLSEMNTAERAYHSSEQGVGVGLSDRCLLHHPPPPC